MSVSRSRTKLDVVNITKGRPIASTNGGKMAARIKEAPSQPTVAYLTLPKLSEN